MARWLKHENKFILYLIIIKKGKNNDNKSVYMYEIWDINAETDSNWLS